MELFEVVLNLPLIIGGKGTLISLIINFYQG